MPSTRRPPPWRCHSSIHVSAPPSRETLDQLHDCVIVTLLDNLEGTRFRSSMRGALCQRSHGFWISLLVFSSLPPWLWRRKHAPVFAALSPTPRVPQYPA